MTLKKLRDGHYLKRRTDRAKLGTLSSRANKYQESDGLWLVIAYW